MLDPIKELPLRKLYFHNIARIVIAMLCWSMLYHIYHLFITENFSFFTLWHAFKQTLLFKQEFHFYYLHIIILVYIMVPVIRVFTRSATKVELRYALLVWFALGIVYPTFKMIYPLSMLSGIPLQWMINMTYSSIGYLLLGHYLSEYPLSKSLSVSFTVIGFITVFFGVVFMSAKDESLNTAFFEGMSVGVALYATGIFALCAAKKSPNRFFLNVSNASFCIYLSHMFFVYLIRKIFPCTFSPFLYVPVCVCAVMCASFTVWLILKQIPLISKWLI